MKIYVLSVEAHVGHIDTQLGVYRSEIAAEAAQRADLRKRGHILNIFTGEQVWQRKYQIEVFELDTNSAGKTDDE